jgi:predicted nucleotide-binding protein
MESKKQIKKANNNDFTELHISENMDSVIAVLNECLVNVTFSDFLFLMAYLSINNLILMRELTKINTEVEEKNKLIMQLREKNISLQDPHETANQRSVLNEKPKNKKLQQRPRVFVGSSMEGLSVAEAIQVNLDKTCEVTLWNQGLFDVGEFTLDSLRNSIDNFDFAVLVLTPDDVLESRGEAKVSPRDNILFELGLCINHLGRERTLMVVDRSVDLKLPSDMAGVNPAKYQPHSSGNFVAALGASCTKLKKVIKQLGPRLRSQIAPAEREYN